MACALKAVAVPEVKINVYTQYITTHQAHHLYIYISGTQTMATNSKVSNTLLHRRLRSFFFFFRSFVRLLLNEKKHFVEMAIKHRELECAGQ